VRPTVNLILLLCTSSTRFLREMTFKPIYTKDPHHGDSIDINGDGRRCCQASGRLNYPRLCSNPARGPRCYLHPRRQRATAWHLPHWVLIFLSLIHQHHGSLVLHQPTPHTQVLYKPPWPPPAAIVMPPLSTPIESSPSSHREPLHCNLATSATTSTVLMMMSTSQYCPWVMTPLTRMSWQPRLCLGLSPLATSGRVNNVGYRVWLL